MSNTAGEDHREAEFSPNDHGVEYDDIEEGDSVRLYSCTTEGIATGVVMSKKLNESPFNEGTYYADITVDIDPEHLHSGTVSAQEFCELPQIREVLD